MVLAGVGTAGQQSCVLAVEVVVAAVVGAVAAVAVAAAVAAVAAVQWEAADCCLYHFVRLGG